LRIQLIQQGKAGDTELLEETISQFKTHTVPSAEEESSIEVARSFAAYSASARSTKEKDSRKILLSWWVRPFPGNFGDWLSPFIYKHYLSNGIRIIHQPINSSTRDSPEHIISVGSVGRFIKKNSIVVGTGISSNEFLLENEARYISVRGPITAKHIKDNGGPSVNSFGDPAAVISLIMPIERGKTNGRVALVRHFTHAGVSLNLPDNFDEFSILLSGPKSIKQFLTTLNSYDEVVTSAMHVLIVCQSYNIPCSLITFFELSESVSGTGIKYADYALGVGLQEIAPTPVGRDLTEVDFGAIIRRDSIPLEKKKEIESCIMQSIELVT